MPERSDLDRRLRAVERALTDGDHDVAALQDAAAGVERIDAIEARIADLEERTTELEAATQAVRGYVGNVRAVNGEVEDRADAALAAVDRIEARLADLETTGSMREFGTAGERTPTGSTTGSEACVEASDASTTLGGDGYGIEMSPPGSASPAGAGTNDDPQNDGETSERSVIERVREVL